MREEKMEKREERWRCEYHFIGQPSVYIHTAYPKNPPVLEAKRSTQYSTIACPSLGNLGDGKVFLYLNNWLHVFISRHRWFILHIISHT